MSTQLPYIIEKFDQAAYLLATGEGAARSRVGAAYRCFWHIPLEDFPETIHGDRREITTMLTRLGGRQGYVIPENLRRMKNSTAAEIARLILSIRIRVLEARTREAAQPPGLPQPSGPPA